MTATFFPIITSDDPPTAPSGWEWRSLGEVAQLRSGHTPSRREEDYWIGGDVLWLSLKDIKGLQGRYVLDTENKPTQKGIDNTSAPILPKGTVAFCRTASVGKVVILGRDMATSQDFANWVCGRELLPEYLYEALRASGGQFNKEKQGSTHKTIYMPTLERFRVLLPPLPEQRRIADILDKADAIGRKRKEAIALTEELLRSVFLEMFGDPVTNPKGWPCRNLGQLADEMRYGTSEKCVPEAGDDALPVLRIPNVVRGRVNWDELKFATLPPQEVERLRLADGDLLFVRSNGNPEYIARCAVYEGTIPALFASYLIRVRVRTREVTPSYVQAVLGTRSFRHVLTRSARTTAGNYNISTEGLRSLLLPVPPLDLQREYGRLRRSTHLHLERLNTAAASAVALFDSLVDGAFRGELTAVNGAGRPKLALFDGKSK
jgi:type I restriction enzyme, S subunit